MISASLASLAARLTDTQDREAYANLVTFFELLPPGDDLSRLAEMLGLLALLGQRLPDAVAELLHDLREHSHSAIYYHDRMDERLARLPGEIAAEVDVEGIAVAIGERFRQQIAATSLDTSAQVLRGAVLTIREVAGELKASVRPAAAEYRGIAATLDRETAKLVASAQRLEGHNGRLVAEEKVHSRTLLGLVALAFFLLGLVVSLALNPLFHISSRAGG